MKNFFKNLWEKMKAHKKRTIVISVISFVLICAIISVSLLSAFLFNRFSDGYVPTEEQLLAAKEQYKRVIIIGVDGVGDYFDHVYTPNFDRMFSDKVVTDSVSGDPVQINASVTYTGTAVYPTISCENWTSMFHGVRPVYHGFIFKDTNQRVEAGEHSKNQDKYPSFMQQVLDADSNAKIYSSCTWRGVNNGVIEDNSRIVKVNSEPEQVYQFLNGETIYSHITDLTCQDADLYLRDDAGNIITEKNPSNKKYDEIMASVEAPIEDAKGYLREYLEAQTLLHGYGDETISMRDALTVQRVIEANVEAYVAGVDPETGEDIIKYKVKEDVYTISYMHLDQVDHAGHSYGYGKPGYSDAVSRVDTLIGWLYDAFEEAGMLDDTLFILCTDHGHREAGGHKNHGKNTDLEVNVTFALSGKTVKSGTPGKYVNTDLAAIVCYALGVKADEDWQGRVPYDMFTLLG